MSAASEYRWTDIVPWLGQPQLTSPASGALSNANDPPWYATLPMYDPNPDDYFEQYPWIAPFPNTPDTGGSFGWRAKACLRHTIESIERSRARLGETNSTLVGASFEDFVAASMSVETESAKHLLSTLLELAG